MNDLRTAAQQALEAMDREIDTRRCKASTLRAMIALRAALAQQQANPPGCEHCNHPLYAATKCRVCGRVTEQAEPVEPVAWCSSVEFSDALKYAQSFNGWRRKYPKTDMPLYTAPPKAEPLPMKEVERLIYGHTKINPNVADDRELLGYIVNAARAIERAHGIG